MCELILDCPERPFLKSGSQDISPLKKRKLGANMCESLYAITLSIWKVIIYISILRAL